jgi:signal peptidase I
MAIPGDTIEFKYGEPYKNGRLFILPKSATRSYLCISKNKKYTDSLFLLYEPVVSGDSIYVKLNDSEYNIIKHRDTTKFSIKHQYFDRGFQDYGIKFNKMWNRDFFGPLVIPNTLITKDTSNVLVTGGYSSSQLAKDTVYFIIGDAIQNSYDSRYVGLVSKKLIIGKLER